jgi:uroporphyrinogen decarboxylase
MSREHYLRHIKPRHAKFFRRVRELSPARLMFHSCGSIASILPDLVETGVQIINPVQVTAAGMDPALLKREFGRDLVFWGGTDSQKTLPFGSEAEVRAMVRSLVDTLAPGFVFANCHNIQPDVPLENVLAMFDEARNHDHVPAR